MKFWKWYWTEGASAQAKWIVALFPLAFVSAMVALVGYDILNFTWAKIFHYIFVAWLVLFWISIIYRWFRRAK